METLQTGSLLVFITAVVSPLVTELLKRVTALDEENPSLFDKFSTLVNQIVSSLIMVGAAMALGEDWKQWLFMSFAAAGLGTAGFNLIKGMNK